MSSPASRSSRSNEIEFPKSYRVLRNRVKSNVRISTILTSRTKIYNLSIVGSISVYNSLVIYDVRYYIYVWYFLDRYFYRVLLSIERWLKFSPMGLFSRETTHREDETLNFLNIFNRSSFQTFSSRSKISFHDISYSHIIIILVFWTILCNNRIIIIIKPFKRVSPDDKTLSNRLD